MSSRCSTARLSWDSRRWHRAVDFLRQRLEAAADLRNLVDPVVVRSAARALQQLEIIDHDQTDATLPLEPPGARAQRRDRQARRIVDKQRQAFKITRRTRKIAEILLADLAHAQIFRADPGLLGKDTRRQLIGRHFEAKERDGRHRPTWHPRYRLRDHAPAGARH